MSRPPKFDNKQFGKAHKKDGIFDADDYLNGNTPDKHPVHCPAPIDIERAQEVSDIFLAYEEDKSAYSYIKKSIEDRANHYQLEDNKSLAFFNEALRFDYLKASLIREIERMSVVANLGKEETWWYSSYLRYTAWAMLCLAKLDNKLVSAKQLSCTGKTAEACRKTLREAEDRGYATSKIVDYIKYYQVNISSVNKYYRVIHGESRRASLESITRLATFHSFAKFEHQFVKAFGQNDATKLYDDTN
jgi:hypothetical protein